MENYKNAILPEIAKVEIKLREEPMVVLEKIKDYDNGDLYRYVTDKYAPDYNEYKKFIETLYAKYLDVVFELLSKTNDSLLRGKIREFALRFKIVMSHAIVLEDNFSIILSRLGDDESFEILMEESKKILEEKVDAFVNKAPLVYLLTFYEVEKYQKRIKEYLLSSYDYAREFALKNRIYDYQRDNLNADIYLVISQGIMSLKKEHREEFADLFFRAYEFASSKERRCYSMNQISGYMAIYITAFSKKIDISILDKCITITGRYYQDNKFVFQTRYAKWYLEKNSSAAIDFFKESKCYDQIGYIAALFADLDCKNGLPFLEEKIKEIADPVVTEIFLEAISRLKTQQHPPYSEERMIWMFESVSATQRALGADSDNIFLQRARVKAEIDSTVYETDDE